MELTLGISPADAAKLQRLPAVKAARSGRARSAATRIVWHDSPDRALAAQGLALAEERGVWRLERHRPGATEPWPPATDHRLIETANDRDGLARHLPESTTPAAAFEGRRTVLPVTLGGDPVSITILDGILRAVAAERPAARLTVDGPASRVRSLLLTLAETLSLTVPEQSLAMEALRLADGTAPAARRTGAPVLPAGDLSVQAAFAHILAHLTDVVVHLAPKAGEPGGGPEPVHQMRVAVRRARSALAIFPSEDAGRDDPGQETPAPTDPGHENPRPGNAGWRAVSDGLKRLGQKLGPARDWDVFMTETVPPVTAALPERAGLRSLLRAGERRRLAARADLTEYLGGPEFRLLMLELSCLTAATLATAETETPLAEFAATVIQSRWKKLLKAGKDLEKLDDPGLHRVRLKAKRLRYAAEFFAPLFAGKPTTRFIRRLVVLQERLGLFNDTSVAETLLRELSGHPGHAAGIVLGFAAARGAGARPRIAAAWNKMRRRDPFWV